MKNLILPFLLFLTTYSFGQSVISSVNTGAVSNNNLIYSVGEIFVNPTTNPNEANSGLIGALSRIEFFVTGITDKIVSDDLRVYPNPTTSSICFSSTDNNFREIYIYDLTGRLVGQTKDINNPFDLSSFPNGTYSIHTDNKNIKSFKIIKQ